MLENREHSHQPPDERMKVPLVIVGALAAFCVLGLVVAALFVGLFSDEERMTGTTVKDGDEVVKAFSRQFSTRDPLLQPAPAREHDELRLEEDTILSTYGWIDRDQSRARIPIERAMELILERGLPARE